MVSDICDGRDWNAPQHRQQGKRELAADAIRDWIADGDHDGEAPKEGPIAGDVSRVRRRDWRDGDGRDHQYVFRRCSARNVAAEPGKRAERKRRRQAPELCELFVRLEPTSMHEQRSCERRPSEHDLADAPEHKKAVVDYRWVPDQQRCR